AHAKLALEVQIGCRDERMNATPRCRIERKRAGLDVGGRRTRQPTNDRRVISARDSLGDGSDGFLLASLGGWESGFDDVDTECAQLVGGGDRLGHGPGTSCRL